MGYSSSCGRKWIKFANGLSQEGILIELVGNAKVLTPDQQQLIFNLVSNEEIQVLMSDPFELQFTIQDTPPAPNLMRSSFFEVGAISFKIGRSHSL